jgi:hypothetical protein
MKTTDYGALHSGHVLDPRVTSSSLGQNIPPASCSQAVEILVLPLS